MIKKLYRSVAALVITFTCLILMSAPAGAVTTSVTASIPSGNFRLQNGTSILDVPLSGSTGTGCTVNLDAVFDMAATSNGTMIITDVLIIIRFTVGTMHYILVMTDVPAGAVSGNVNGTTNAITGVGVRLTSNIYPASNPSSTATDCNLSTPLRCRFSNISVTFSGTYTGNLHSITTSHTMAMASNASTTLVGLPCNPPFSIYTGGTLTFTSLNLHITSIP